MICNVVSRCLKAWSLAARPSRDRTSLARGTFTLADDDDDDDDDTDDIVGITEWSMDASLRPDTALLQ